MSQLPVGSSEGASPLIQTASASPTVLPLKTRVFNCQTADLAAAHDNFIASLKCQVQHDAVAQIEERDGVLMVALGTRLPAAPFNVAVRVGNIQASIAFDVAFDWFGRKGRGVVFCSHGSADADLEREALRRGLLPCGDLPVMTHTRRAEPTTLRGHELEAVSTPAQFASFKSTAARAFATSGLPTSAVYQAFSRTDCLGTSKMKLYLLRVSGNIVGCGALLSHARSVGIYWVAVPPEFRGQGHGNAVARLLVERARGEERDHIVLQSSPDGERLYHQLGFREITRLRLYCRPFAISS